MTKLEDRNRQAIKNRQPGDIIFFHPVSFNPLAKLILIITSQHYHHGAIVISDQEIIEADPGSGVHLSLINNYLNSYELDLFRLKENPNPQKIAEAALAYNGWGYDYGNVLWAGMGWIIYKTTGLNIFRRLTNPYDKKQAVHSEEYIEQVFIDCGINLRETIPSTNVTAQDISESPYLFKVCED